MYINMSNKNNTSNKNNASNRNNASNKNNASNRNNAYMTTPPTSNNNTNNNNNNKKNNNNEKKNNNKITKPKQKKMSLRERLTKEMDKQSHKAQMLKNVKTLLKDTTNLTIFNQRQLHAFYDAGLITKNHYNRILLQKQMNSIRL